MTRPTSARTDRIEIAIILSRHGLPIVVTTAGSYRRVRAAGDDERHLGACRTEALGGPRRGLRRLLHERIAYNSCGNRHWLRSCQESRPRELAGARKPEPACRVPSFPPSYLRFMHNRRDRLQTRQSLMHRVKAAAEARTTRLLTIAPASARRRRRRVLPLGTRLTHPPHSRCCGRGLSPDGTTLDRSRSELPWPSFKRCPGSFAWPFSKRLIATFKQAPCAFRRSCFSC